MIAISSSSSTSTINIGSQVMELLTVFVSDNVTSSSTGISTENNSILKKKNNPVRFDFISLFNAQSRSTYLENKTNNSGTCFNVCRRSRHGSLTSKGCVTDAVVKAEASFSQRINVAKWVGVHL